MAAFAQFAAFLVAAIFHFSLGQEISVYVNNGNYTYKLGLYDDADVEASFVDSCMTTGWGRLQVQINDISTSNATDTEKMFAAGLAEGYLTSKQIYQTYLNLVNTSFWDFTYGPSDELKNFITTQSQWEQSMIANNSDDMYWQMVDNVNQQLRGLWYGYNISAAASGVPVQSSLWIFKFLNILPDLLDLEMVLNVSARPDFSSMSAKDFMQWRLSRGHCSAMIKVSPVLDNMFLGHSTWMIYQNMNRIFKLYNFSLFGSDTASKSEGTKGTKGARDGKRNQQRRKLQPGSEGYHGSKMLFSSYPGMLQSQDDFYVMNNLVMLQTTNSILNLTLYDLIQPKVLWYWERIRIAHALSSSGSDWFNYFSQYNSGTYNNQYMLIDYKLFEAGQPLADGLLWVVEQIPGTVAGQDMTQVLKRGYFGSYNVPAIEEIYNKSGYPAAVQQFGVANSYDMAPRARIMRRDANNIASVDDLKDFMRYNNYVNDTIEQGNPMWAICSRGDIAFNGTAGSTFGCYDSKIANLDMILNGTALAISGPTTSNGISPFNFDSFPMTPHNGIATNINFTWQTMGKIF